MTTPTPTPTPPQPVPGHGEPAGGAPTPTPQPNPPTPAPAVPGAPEPPTGDVPPDDEFTSDRQKRRFAELTGRVGVRERERDEALARVEAMQWREVERIAAMTLAVAGDVRLETPVLADLLDPDSGEVDPVRVAAAVAAVVTQRPGLRRTPTPRPLPGGGAVQSPVAAPTLADAMRRIAERR